MSDRRDRIRVEYTTQDGEQCALYPQGDIELNPPGMGGVVVRVWMEPEPDEEIEWENRDRRHLIIPWRRIDEIEFRPEGFTSEDYEEAS